MTRFPLPFQGVSLLVNLVHRSTDSVRPRRPFSVTMEHMIPARVQNDLRRAITTLLIQGDLDRYRTVGQETLEFLELSFDLGVQLWRHLNVTALHTCFHRVARGRRRGATASRAPFAGWRLGF